MKPLAQSIEKFKESIFATLSQKANEQKAINLAQGFPDFNGPDWVTQLLKDSVQKKFNQYAPLQGIPKLRKTIVENFLLTQHLNYDWQNEITVTHGATEGIFCSILACVNPGDEVIIFEPFYDSYLASIRLAGATPVPVTLKAPDFKFDKTELEKAFSDKTKLVIFNNPHNPSGRVMNEQELRFLSKLVVKNDTYLLSDEVYEFLTYDQHIHHSIAKFPGMRDRVMTASSLGKTFGLTGWKIGWVIASEKLTHAIRMVHQFTTFCAHHPTQNAAAEALAQIESYLPEFKKTYQQKRDFFISGLEQAGFKPFHPEGTYFTMVPIPKEIKLNDIEYVHKLVDTIKVAAIPPSAFYLNSNDGTRYLRFCFAKKEETLIKAIDLLKKGDN